MNGFRENGAGGREDCVTKEGGGSQTVQNPGGQRKDAVF